MSNDSAPLPNGEPTSKRGLPATFSAFSIPSYRWYWSGNLASFFAQFMQMPAQAWLAFQLTHSPLMLGLVSAAQGVPQFVFNLFSGVIIDRVQKRDIIRISQAAIIINTLAIAILITTGHIQYWNLLIAAFLTGSINAFNMPARNSMVSELVPQDKLYNAYALNAGATNTAKVAAPALAGLLISWMGTQGAYYVGAAFNVIAIASVSFLPATSKPRLVAGVSYFDNIKEGFRYLKLHNILLLLLGMEVVLTFFGMSYQGLMPVFADMLQVNAQAYGFMMSAIGVGALVGSIVIASLGNFKRKGLLLIFAGVAFGAMLVIFGNSGRIGDFLHIGSNLYYMAAFFLMLMGLSAAAYTATSLTLIQMSITDEVRGRVTSMYQMVTALSPVSFSFSGALAQGFGTSMALTIMGTCLAFFFLIMGFFNSRLRKLS